MEPDINTFSNEVLHAEIALYPTDLNLRLFIGGDTPSVADVMTRQLGQTPEDWEDAIMGKSSTTFRHEAVNGQTYIILYLRAPVITHLNKEAMACTWLLAKEVGFSINEETANLQTCFTNYIVEAVLNTVHSIREEDETDHQS